MRPSLWLAEVPSCSVVEGIDDNETAEPNATYQSAAMALQYEKSVGLWH